MRCVEETWCHEVCGGDLVPWSVWRRPGAMGCVEETWWSGVCGGDLVPWSVYHALSCNKGIEKHNICKRCAMNYTIRALYTKKYACMFCADVIFLMELLNRDCRIK